MTSCKNYLLIPFILLLSCKSQHTGTTSTERLEIKIVKKLGEQNKRTNNFDNTFVLAFSEDNTSGTPIIRYGVWAINSGELIYANTAVRGNVKWLDNTSLLVEDYPGIIEGDHQNYKFKIDLNTKVKIPVYETENK